MRSFDDFLKPDTFGGSEVADTLHIAPRPWGHGSFIRLKRCLRLRNAGADLVVEKKVPATTGMRVWADVALFGSDSL